MKRNRRMPAASKPVGREISVEETGFVDGPPAAPKASSQTCRMVRVGWREAAQAIAAAGDDVLVMGDFGCGCEASTPWEAAGR